jgi:lactoylglutathione lyase
MAEPDRLSPLAVAGLFEAHLAVADLERSVAFYRDVVGLPLALSEPKRGAVFFWVPASGKGLLGLWSLGSAPMAMNLHLAFSVRESDVHAAVERLSAAGVQPLSFFGSATHEPSVIAWMPAVAVYFRDPDGHLLELIAMLEEEPRPELGVVGWSTWSELTEQVRQRRPGAQP